MSIEIDNMEYSTNALAQTAYVSNASYDSYTKLISHFEGSDGATSYSDPIAGAYTFVGTAQLDTAQYKFSTASLLLDGNSDYVTLPDSNSWDFGTGDFTLEAWFRLAVDIVTDSNNVYRIIGRRYISTGDNGNWVLGVGSHSVWGTNKRINFVFRSNDVVTDLSSNEVTINKDTWYHVAVVRDSGTIRFFLDGVSVGTGACSADLSSSSSIQVGASLRQTDVSLEWFNGWIDEVRISKGIARWTSNFTPPTSPYDKVLQSYSESTIKTQGSYSLKAIASATDSLNKTLTYTLGSSINLSGVKKLKFNIYSSRTGSNVKIGIHDSGGTTTEITPTISSSSIWQEVTWDVSTVSDANKDVIDSIIITIVNADSDNTFYIDNFYAVTQGGIIFII